MRKDRVGAGVARPPRRTGVDHERALLLNRRGAITPGLLLQPASLAARLVFSLAAASEIGDTEQRICLRREEREPLGKLRLGVVGCGDVREAGLDVVERRGALDQDRRPLKMQVVALETHREDVILERRDGPVELEFEAAPAIGEASVAKVASKGVCEDAAEQDIVCQDDKTDRDVGRRIVESPTSDPTPICAVQMAKKRHRDLVIATTLPGRLS